MDLAPPSPVLCHFRDQYLMDDPLGQIAVASYYTMSPALAGVIVRHESLRQLAQKALTPVVPAVKWTLSR